MSDRDQANYSQIALICIICRKRGPSGETEPEGWALWTRTPPTYFLHTCPKHSTHEGLWAPVEPPVLSRAAWKAKIDALITDVSGDREKFTYEWAGYKFEDSIAAMCTLRDAILESLSQEASE